jgi:hypothetical protein
MRKSGAGADSPAACQQRCAPLLGVADPGRCRRCPFQIKQEQKNIIDADRELYQHGITSSVEGVETDIYASKTDEQLADVKGKMKAIEARLTALTGTSAIALTRHALPATEASPFNAGI